MSVGGRTLLDVTTTSKAKIRRRLCTTLVVSLCICCTMMTVALASISGNSPGWNQTFGALLNIAAAVMLVWRYQYPWHALALAVAGPIVFETDATASLFALFAITAFVRGWKLAAAAAVTFLACGVSLTYDAFRRRDYSVLTIGHGKIEEGQPVPEWNLPLWIPWFVAVMMVLAVVGLGLLRKTQSDLAAAELTLDRATHESNNMREEMARTAERARIARDMHDTLAASLSRISLFAGGLQVNSNEGSVKVAAQATLIHDTAHNALDDLRRIIGVLRSDGNDAGSTGTRSMADLPDLVSSARQSGMRVTLYTDVANGQPGSNASRVAYRVVQEALTNAQKHANGSPVSVAVYASAETGVRVDVRNSVNIGVSTANYGSRTGLIGLAEQVHGVGGTFDAREWPGQFVVSCWLPWRP
ncbi:histidine kinase [Nocardiaceae bacterium YC2-7]|uniref:histidine kinase n=1 Tax=Antrihabitans stalactiti TaxID=2584121 RepID=A0A848KHQ0_9NOCA|nr:histidine kinase [Antrihabitans stalactiti]